MGKRLDELKQCFRLDNIRRIKGSAAILMALVVSGSVATVIFVSQNTLTQFMSARSKRTVNWQMDLAVQYGLHLGGYLVANNVILCREGGWRALGDTGPLCKWTDAKEKGIPSPSDYDLTDKTAVVVGEQSRKQLRYNGTKDIEGQEYSYQLFFDLVNWKDARMSSLMGEVPDTLCRNTKLQVVEGLCDQADQEHCKKPGGADIKGTHCEYIANMDQDMTIVLLKVVILDEDENPVGSPKYAGIRRPLAAITLEVATPPKCELSCASGFGGLFPECRSSPTAESAGIKTGVSSMELRVHNQGPGAIYALSLLRMDKPTSSTASCEDKAGHSDCTYMVTPDLLKFKTIEVFFPGDEFTFTEPVDCSKKTIVKEIVKRQICQGGRWENTDCKVGSLTVESVSINPHIQPFSEIVFDLFSMQSMKNSWGACMKEGFATSTIDLKDWIVAKDNKDCGPGGIEGKTCGEGKGKCRYPDIEPKRIFAPGSGSGHGSFHIQQEILKVINKFVMPH